jgi:hypothetical protein
MSAQTVFRDDQLEVIAQANAAVDLEQLAVAMRAVAQMRAAGEPITRYSSLIRPFSRNIKSIEGQSFGISTRAFRVKMKR